MMQSKEAPITVETTIKASLEYVWEVFTESAHIVNWNFASDQWHCPSAKNNLRSGGKFKWRMEAKDGSMGFDFSGTYDEIEGYKKIKYTLDDGRKTELTFSFNGESTKIIESFEAEHLNSLEIQRAGWQSIMDNLKKYAEEISL